VTVGIRQQVNDRFSVSAGFEWTNWSRLRYPRVIDQTTGLPYAASPLLYLGYKDGWFASLGAEYALTPQWTVRAGLAYEKSPIDTSSRSLRLPDSDRIWATLGASYAWNDRLTFDVAYAHIFARKAGIVAQPGTPGYQPGYGPLLASVDNQGDVISAGLRFRWDDPTRPVPAVMPVVRKD
jgi:long-chain fatty acid transport protein